MPIYLIRFRKDISICAFRRLTSISQRLYLFSYILCVPSLLGPFPVIAESLAMEVIMSKGTEGIWALGAAVGAAVLALLVYRKRGKLDAPIKGLEYEGGFLTASSLSQIIKALKSLSNPLLV